MHIVHDADDAILLLAPQEDFANGILVGPVDSGSGGVDQDNSLAMGAVVPGELAPVEADAHGADESWRDDIDQGVGQFVGSKGFSLRHGRIPFAVGSQRKVVGHACGLDAWKRAHAGKNPLEDRGTLGDAGVLGRERSAVVVVDFDARGSLRPKAQVDLKHLNEAAQEQTCCYQQNAS